LAFQIAQDLAQNDNQGFINQIIQHFPTINPSETDEFLKNIESNIKPKLFKVLNGKFSEEVHQHFLKNNNNSDPLIIANIKNGADSKNSIIHEAIIMANSILQAGTTSQNFLVENLEWIAKASHWANFTSVASLGVIHRGNYSRAMEVMRPYLPGNLPTPKFYAHGGSLYGLGLIYYNTKNQETLNFLINAIKNPTNNQNEVLIHGACLGIGLVGMASNDEMLYEEMKNVLFTDSATTGEAAGLAIGLIMAGSRNGNVINDILEYAHETKHEKIIRSIAISLSIIMFNAEEKADALIEELCNDKDAILRYI
jgi:26S proteasome regulatory subunit N2